MANDFTWHKVTEEEKNEIQKKAKAIMDNFSSKLDNINLPEESFIVREDGIRKNEETSCKINREIMFSNAKQKTADFIVAEKKKW